MSPDPRKMLALAVLLLGYLGLSGLEHTRIQVLIGVAPLDPAIGLALSGLLLGGPAFLPVLPLGELGAAVIRSGWPPPLLSTMITVATVTVGWGGAALILRRITDLRLAGQHSLFLLILVTGAASLVTAGGDTVVALLGERLPTDEAARTLARAWIGDMIGVMLITPLVLVHRHPTAPPSRAVTVEIVSLALVSATMLWLLLWLPSASEWQMHDLLVLPSIWAAARFGVKGAVAINVALQIGMLAAFITVPRDPDAVIAHQVRTLVLTLSTLFLGVAVTERRRAEDSLRRRQDQFDRCARLSIAGEMAAALAHELNQPLSAALTYARAAQRLLPATPGDHGRLRQALDGAAVQAERAGMIIRTLREFIGRGELNAHPHPLPGLVRESLALLAPDCDRTGVRIEAAFDRALPAVTVDAVQIQQVLVNLVRNAIEAMDLAGYSRRMVTITARLAESGLVEVEVADSGPGIDSDQMARLFQPFSTTKAAGMGLGLAICRTIIEAHGGRLWLARNGPGGCSLRFTLPAVAAPEKAGGSR